MAISFKHTTQAVGTDAGNGEIGKTQWNEDHTLLMGTGKLLGRSTAGDGAVEEIALGSGLTLAGGELTAESGGTPGGSDTQVQFNDGGVFGGDAGLTFNKTTGRLTVGSSGQFAFSTDLLLTRKAAANLRLGAADAAAPAAQTLSVQSVVAGTTNTAGANLTITGSQGTGTGAGGSIVFQVAPAGSSGTAQNALADALTISSTKAAEFLGQIITQSLGQSANPVLVFSGDLDTGLFRRAANAISFSCGGIESFILTGAGAFIPASLQFGFNSGNLGQGGTSVDTGIARSAANKLVITNGSTGAGSLVFRDEGNIEAGTTTGTKIGTATTQKLGFWNATPVVQPGAVADATDAPSVITQLNALLAHMRTLGLIAT
jgi:hypothetical protein